MDKYCTDYVCDIGDHPFTISVAGPSSVETQELQIRMSGRFLGKERRDYLVGTILEMMSKEVISEEKSYHLPCPVSPITCWNLARKQMEHKQSGYL
jgi:hypothetical protein